MSNELVKGILALVSGESVGAASETAFTPAGTIVATNVQAAIEEVSGDVVTLGGEAVRLTGNQTIAGVKTFASAPVVPAVTGSTAQLVLGTSGGSIAYFSAGSGVHSQINAYYAFYTSSAAGGLGSSNGVRLTTEQADGAGAVACEVDTTTAWSTSGAKLHSWRTANAERAYVTVGGEFGSTVSGAGVLLRSPDGTLYRVSVANGGTVQVSAV